MDPEMWQKRKGRRGEARWRDEQGIEQINEVNVMIRDDQRQIGVEQAQATN